MTVYTLSEAERKLHEVLEQASAAGEVRIQRDDGKQFVVRPAAQQHSPLDVRGVNIAVSAADIVSAVRDGRER